MAKFDAKTFNAEAFGAYINAVPNVRLNRLKGIGAVKLVTQDLEKFSKIILKLVQLMQQYRTLD